MCVCVCLCLKEDWTKLWTVTMTTCQLHEKCSPKFVNFLSFAPQLSHPSLAFSPFPSTTQPLHPPTISSHFPILCLPSLALSTFPLPPSLLYPLKFRAWRRAKTSWQFWALLCVGPGMIRIHVIALRWKSSPLLTANDGQTAGVQLTLSCELRLTNLTVTWFTHCCHVNIWSVHLLTNGI